MSSETATPLLTGWKRGDPAELLIEREWLVTNGLGGYASGTLGGACTRRFHGKLIAAMPAPRGRIMMLNHLEESVSRPDGIVVRLSGDESGGGVSNLPDTTFLESFDLERGVPCWSYASSGLRIEKRVVMPYTQNTTLIVYRIVEAPPGLTLHLRPSLFFRPHEGLLTNPVSERWTLQQNADGIEISDGSELAPLRIAMIGPGASLVREERRLPQVLYRIEKSRGYEHEGALWSPGVMQIPLVAGQEIGIIASVESWETIRAINPASCMKADMERRTGLLDLAAARKDPAVAQLVLAADQFLIRPHTRSADGAQVRAAGDEARTVIAGYHWFTDWGRDTMISLEGLTLVTGRHAEAASILRTFASYIRDGLIPNMFPEGDHEGLYHTADATLWFFHAVRRYLQHSNDRATVNAILPRLVEIIDHHVRGTRFNICVDPADGLLSQGAAGYQLTWMDAKVGDWVVTPRRGKAVEINALFYNALRITQELLAAKQETAEAERIGAIAGRVRESFNRRFWQEEAGYLYDVVDTEGGGNDPAIRPNQIFAVSLDYPVLDEQRWKKVVDVVRERLLTPVGLRSLAPEHPDYKRAYDGDLRARDAAYHQGTVWSWLIGPFLDAWLKVYPQDSPAALALLGGFVPHLSDACIGTISEVFDGEPPYHSRGCVAQAWGVAEVLRSLHRLSAAGES